MNAPIIRIGIDRRGDRLFAARVESGAGRNEIKALFRFDDFSAVSPELLDGGRISLSVPDSKVIVKRLVMEPGESELKPRIAFELCQLLMEEEKNLLVDSVDTGRSDQFLGLAIRKESFRSIAEQVLGRTINGSGEIDSRMRAAALADGFLKFCKPVGGELIGLVDVCAGETSVVFVYRGKVIDLSHIPARKIDLNSERRLEQAAIELKTLINFRLDAFFRSGISLPLSALVVIGDGIDDAARRSLANQFPVEIKAAEFNRGFLPERYSTENLPLEKYLVPLGLAAN